MTYLTAFFRTCALWLLPVIGVADTISPRETVLLVVEVPGKFGDSSSQVQFTMEDLRKMPSVDIETETIWFTGAQHFAGVRLVELMEAVGVTEGTLAVSTGDGFSIDIDMSLAAEFGTVIAYKRNGEPMTVRKKGPLRLVYDYDEFPPLVREKLYSHTIWQITKIQVVPENGKEGSRR